METMGVVQCWSERLRLELASYLVGVPKVEPFERLEKAHFLRAMVACVMRARRIPDVVRSDRGPEMTSAVTEEFSTLCNAKQFWGAAFTPRHQGAGERAHQEVMTQWLILIHKTCRAFPQEWDTLAPAVEYLMATEIGECGFSAHELETGCSLLQEPDVTLAPFLVPLGTAQTDLAARPLSNFRELAGILNRHKAAKFVKKALQVNQTRHLHQLIAGETVFRRMPSKARPAKHLLGEPSSGPYAVVRQNTLNSVVLQDPATEQFVDGGANIPLEQILAGPRRSLFELKEPTGARSVGQMIAGESNAGALPPEVRSRGWKPSKKGGWKGLARGQYVAYRPHTTKRLAVALVLYNDRGNQSVEVQTCRSIWAGMAVSTSWSTALQWQKERRS